MNWIDRTYSGEERLWKVFWLGYMAPLLPLTIGFGIYKEKSANFPAWVGFVFLMVILLYQAWLAIAMWHCAPNVKHRAFYFLGRLVAGLMGVMVIAAGFQLLTAEPIKQSVERTPRHAVEGPTDASRIQAQN
jgi:threonine/homoserine/homoserine lactone efflux protein